MKKIFVALLTPLAFSTLACGFSPLFNHNNDVPASPAPAAVRGATPPASPSTQGECPIAFTKSGLCASLTWDSQPSFEDENSGTLRFWDAATSSASGPYRDVDGVVAVKLWMPSMGHGSSPVTVTAQGGGVYSATQVYFIMKGDWDVIVQIKKDGKIVDQATVSISLK